jgi:N-acetyl sugar amidotransferase
LDELVSEYKGKSSYDCIVPYSGGKDSVFQLYYIVRVLKLRPLVIRYDHWGFRPLVDENNENVFKQLGVSVMRFTPNWKLVRALMLEGLRTSGDFCWHCHTGIYAYVTQLAILHKIPLIIWGESNAEYTAHVSFNEIQGFTEELFIKICSMNVGFEKMRERLSGQFDPREFDIFAYPSAEVMIESGCKPIYLGDYINWDTKANVELIKRELGWKGQEVEGIPPEYDYEKIECKWQGIRDYCKYIKRGYGRTAHLVALDIRNGRLTTEQGERLVKEYDAKRPKSLDLFLKTVGISEDEFYKILKEHEVAPWQFSDDIEDGKELNDMKYWNTRI